MNFFNILSGLGDYVSKFFDSSEPQHIENNSDVAPPPQEPEIAPDAPPRVEIDQPNPNESDDLWVQLTLLARINGIQKHEELARNAFTELSATTQKICDIKDAKKILHAHQEKGVDFSKDNEARRILDNAKRHGLAVTVNYKLTKEQVKNILVQIDTEEAKHDKQFHILKTKFETITRTSNECITSSKAWLEMIRNINSRAARGISSAA